jgi:hypothetical protein
MGDKIKREEYEPLDAGIYPATVAEVTTAEGTFGPQWVFKFRLEDEETGEEHTLMGWASKKFSPKAKLFGWVKVLMFGGREIPADFQEIDSDMLVGKRCLVSVGIRQKEDGTPGNRVDDLLPLRVKRSNGSTPAPTATDDRSMPKPRSGVPAVNTPADPPLPEDVPDWLTGDDEGLPF